MSAILPTTVTATPINPTPNLELTEAEQLEVQKWMKKYAEASKTGRYMLLKSKILPSLYPLNTHLTIKAWKLRKSVSKKNIFYWLL